MKIQKKTNELPREPSDGAALLNAIRGPTDLLGVTADGILTIAGQKATALLEEFGSPLAVTVEPTLRANYRRIKQAFSKRWPSTVNVMYSLKCNNTLAVRSVLSDEGAGGDCFGLGELFATLQGGADPKLVAMNGSNKSFAEVKTAVELGIVVNVDSEDEIGFLSKAILQTGKQARVNLRLKVLPSDLDAYITEAYRTTESFVAGVKRVKWGFELVAAAIVVQALRALDGITLLGYSGHIGHLSNQPGAFASLARALGQAAISLEAETGFRPAVLDIGGGWAQHREPPSRGAGINPYSIEDYAQSATDALREGLRSNDNLPELWIEPGRYIAANAELLLASVGSIKRDAGYVWLHVDASTNNLPRIESGRQWHYVLPASRMTAPLAEAVEIVGSTCFKSVLGTGRLMPSMSRGDAIAILDTGAYAEVFANQFNGLPRPAGVLVSEAGVDLIKRRETIDDIFATHLVPRRLTELAPAHPSAAAILQKNCD
jgi:diaminopimelate decarboxylase